MVPAAVRTKVALAGQAAEVVRDGVVHIAAGGGPAACGVPAILVPSLHESPQARWDPVTGHRVRMAAGAGRAEIVTRIVRAVTGITRRGRGQYPLERPRQRERKRERELVSAPGRVLPAPRPGRHGDDDLAKWPRGRRARRVGRRASGAAGRTDPGHGQRLPPSPDHDDPPLAGGIGHGGLSQVPGHCGRDRADTAQLTWHAGQAGQCAPRHAEFGSSLQQFANRLIAQLLEVQPGELAQARDAGPG